MCLCVCFMFPMFLKQLYYNSTVPLISIFKLVEFVLAYLSSASFDSLKVYYSKWNKLSYSFWKDYKRNLKRVVSDNNGNDMMFKAKWKIVTVLDRTLAISYYWWVFEPDKVMIGSDALIDVGFIGSHCSVIWYLAIFIQIYTLKLAFSGREMKYMRLLFFITWLDYFWERKYCLMRNVNNLHFPWHILYSTRKAQRMFRVRKFGNLDLRVCFSVALSYSSLQWVEANLEVSLGSKETDEKSTDYQHYRNWTMNQETKAMESINENEFHHTFKAITNKATNKCGKYRINFLLNIDRSIWFNVFLHHK